MPGPARYSGARTDPNPPARETPREPPFLSTGR